MTSPPTNSTPPPPAGAAAPLRVLAITNLFPNPYQPHKAVFNRQEFQTLVRQNLDVTVIAPILWTDEWPARLKNGRKLSADRTTNTAGLKVVHPTYWYPPKLLRNWYGPCFLASIARVGRRLIAEHRPDLIYGSWAYPDGWAAVQLAKRHNLPVVVKINGSDIRALESYPGRRFKTIQALRQADGIVAVSQDLAQTALSWGINPQRIRTVYRGVNRALFHPGDRAEARRRLNLPGSDTLKLGLFVGNLLPVKGLDVLIEAISRLDARGELPVYHSDALDAARPGVRFVLIGGGPLKSKLAEAIRAAGLGDRVELAGPVPLERLPDWYRACDLFVLPSRSEGVPNVILEAAACGAPIVASRVGGVPEGAGLGRSILVEPERPDALAEALSQVLWRPETLPTRPADAPEVGDLAVNLQAQVDWFHEVLDRRDSTRSKREATPSPSTQSLIP
mgnify:CR=1 FL=1